MRGGHCLKVWTKKQQVVSVRKFPVVHLVSTPGSKLDRGVLSVDYGDETARN